MNMKKIASFALAGAMTLSLMACSAHGNEASFEFIVEKAPEYIFILDRDAAIGTNGAKLAQEIMENALDLMLQDLEGELLN